MRLIVLATLVTVCYMVQAVKQECRGPNEEYSDCGSACPSTCETINEEPKACITLCVTGCFCKYGYVRNSEGKCVHPYECTVSKPPCSVTRPKPLLCYFMCDRCTISGKDLRLAC